MRNQALFDGNARKDRNCAYDEAPEQQVYLPIARDRIIRTLGVDFSHNTWVALRLVDVDPGSRGFGYGAGMFPMAENFLRNKGRSAIRVHAKQNAIGFYRRCGYF